MPTPAELYPVVLPWLQALEPVRHASSLAALAHLVSALLVGQSLRPSTLMRALLSSPAVPARQRYKRRQRALERPWLTPAWLGPPLLRAVLTLVPPDREGGCPLALDSVRCGRWEVFTVGVLWHGRALVVGWAVLPYPWPKGRFTPTACALLQQVAQHWPPGRPAHLVADRAFPSHALFRVLGHAGWGWTLRLSARHHVTVAGHCQQVRTLLPAACRHRWSAQPAQYGGAGRGQRGLLVVGRGLEVLPVWQRGPASLQHRARRQARRQQQLRSKHPQQRTDGAPQSDAWMVLFSSHADHLMAVRSYSRRWGIEGAYRDAQGGWDGQHGWDLEPTLQRLQDAGQVAAVVGLWALGSLLQCWLGDQLSAPSTPLAVRTLQQQWTTTGRLSVWGRGRLALTDPSGGLNAWVLETLAAGAQRLRTHPTQTTLPEAA
jgi:hypothetical protein